MPIKGEHKPIIYIIDNNGCFICTSHSKSNGYPQIKHENFKTSRLNRIILEEKLGRPIKEGYLSCHTCNNKGCINPDHLYEGTPKDNSRDAIKDGVRSIPKVLFKATRMYDNKNFTRFNQLKFSIKYGLNKSCVANCLSGLQKIHKGWKFTYL